MQQGQQVTPATKRRHTSALLGSNTCQIERALSLIHTITNSSRSLARPTRKEGTKHMADFNPCSQLQCLLELSRNSKSTSAEAACRQSKKGWQGKGGIRGQACPQPVLLLVWLSESHAHSWVPVTPERSTSSTGKEKTLNFQQL